MALINLAGRLVDDLGNGINGASVALHVVGSPTPTTSTTTGVAYGQDGHWSFTGVAVDNYEVRVSYQGHTRVLTGVAKAQLDRLTLGKGVIVLGSDGTAVLTYPSFPLDQSSVDSPGVQLVGSYDSDPAGGVQVKNDVSFTLKVRVNADGTYRLAMLNTGSTEVRSFDQYGNTYGPSGSTGMTGGFAYIPSAAGPPTGVPTAIAGRVPLYHDSTNNRLYLYSGGAWKYATLT